MAGVSTVGTALLGLGGLGAALHIAGSVLIVFGQASVKVAHAIVDSTGAPSTWAVPRAHPHPPLWRRPDGKWRRQKAGSKAYAAGGWAAFAAGNILRFVAMRFAAQTVLSGLGSLQFVIIPLASRVMLGIRSSGSTALGVSVVLLGNALIMLYGPAEVTFTLEQLRHQWATPAMSTFLVALGSLLCLLQWLHWRLASSGGCAGGGMGPGGLQPQVAATMEGGKAGAGAGAADAAHFNIQSISGSGSIDSSSGKYLGTAAGLGLLGGRDADQAVSVFAGALLFSAVASFVGAWSVLFSKSLTYVASYMPASLTDWYSWFVLAAFLGTAAFWVRQSDRGLRYYPASLIMPLMQAFWMCMSVLEGGIYFDELAGLPSRHLALLMLGLMLALLGAIFMGIAGFIAEKPEHIFHYSAASCELDASECSGAFSPPPMPAAAATATVSVIVEDKRHAATGRVETLSNPVLRAAGGGGGGGHSGVSSRNGFLASGASSSGDAELPTLLGGKPWWRQQVEGGGGGVTRVHAIASPAVMSSSLPELELPTLGVGGPCVATAPGTSPRALDQLHTAVCSPTQQLLSREGSMCSMGGAVHDNCGGGGSGRGASAFERALLEADGSSDTRGGGLLRHDSILLDSLSSSGGKGPLQRR